MSNSDESGVTHTEIPSPFEGLSDIGSLGVIGPKHEGLPWMLDDPYVQVALQAPPSPDSIPGPEEPHSPPLPDFILEPVYPEYMPHEDKVFLAEEQPLLAAASPTAQSPGYVPESDPEEDLEEDDDEDLEEDPVNYPADEGDDGDDEDESSEDDEDKEVDIEGDDEEEEGHPALADSTAVALPAIDQAPSAEETEPFETDESAATPPPHPAYRVTARISIPALVPTPAWSDLEVTRLLAISTSPSSPLSPWSSPLLQIPSPPLPPILSPLPEYGDRREACLLHAVTGRGLQADLCEAMQGTPVVTDVAEFSQRMTDFETRVRRDTEEAVQCTYARLDGYRRLRMSREAWRVYVRLDRRIQTVITKMLAADHKRQVQLTKALKLVKRLQTQMAELQRQLGPAKGPVQPELPEEAEDRPEVTLPPRKRLGIALGPAYEVGESSSAAAARPTGAFETRVRQDTDEVYTRLDDEQSQRQLLAGRLNMLFRDRRAHARTARLMETEARLSREAWGRSMDASDLARAEVMSLRTTVLAQQSEIRELQSADRRRQTVISELLAADYRRQRQLTKALKLVKSLQTQMAELQRQQGPAKGPAQPELPEEAGSSS
ncbi:hypothetical protein Tco_1446485 [Tanacetum coccineum]